VRHVVLPLASWEHYMASSNRPDLQRFLNRLTSRSVLTKEEQQAVLELPSHAAQAKANVDCVRLGERVDHSTLVVAGMIGRFGQDRNGQRQITMIHIPGELADLHSVVLPLSTSALQALSTATVLHIPHAAIRGVAARYPALAEAFWRDCMVDAAIISEWVLNVGRRAARERIAHLLCEIAVRTVGAKSGARDIVFDFLITQDQLADATAMTGVHVNRMLKQLREENLIAIDGKNWTVLDPAGLRKAARYEASYLHLDRAKREPDSDAGKRLKGLI